MKVAYVESAKVGPDLKEHLVPIALALILVLAIVALLGWLPVVNGSTKEVQSRNYWSDARPFSVMNYAADTKSLMVRIRNERNSTLAITAISINGINATGAGYREELGGGDEKTITIAVPEGLRCASNGDLFEYNVAFTYSTKAINGIIQTGARPLIGKCS